jgi:hypothetical protein
MMDKNIKSYTISAKKELRGAIEENPFGISSVKKEVSKEIIESSYVRGKYLNSKKMSKSSL